MKSEKYIVAIDQSTQGTKAMLFDETGAMLRRCDLPHRQIVNDLGWVEHDPEEILRNVVQTVKNLILETRIDPSQIVGIGLSNQRETGVAWDRETGKPLYNAIVWQCGRAKEICNEISRKGYADTVKQHTGIQLSPYFTAGKLAWILRNVPQAAALSGSGRLGMGTVDTWLIDRLTLDHAYKTDYSNASRTQMFNINTLRWDEEVCSLFGIHPENLAEVCASDSLFGKTDLLGLLPTPVPIHCVLGDSHGALYGHGCHTPGSVKTTYGTGSSVAMNIGSKPIQSDDIVTSIAWCMDGAVCYELEGNLNYTGATITWLKDDLKLIQSSKEVGALAKQANPADTTYLVPAFSGLGAPYWAPGAKAMIVGITRNTGKNEVVRAAEESIAYQIADIVKVMERDSGIPITELMVDGGPTRDDYLMQFQSDILDKHVIVPSSEELSGIGVAYGAGIALGIYDRKTIFSRMETTTYTPHMQEAERRMKYDGWRAAVGKALKESCD